MATQKEMAQKYQAQLQRSKVSMQRNREAKKNAGLKQYTIWAKAMKNKGRVGIALYSEEALNVLAKSNQIATISLNKDGKLVLNLEMIDNVNTNDSKGRPAQSEGTGKTNKP